MVMGNYPQALALFEESFKLSRKLKDRHWEMVALWNSAEIHLHQGNYKEGAPLLATCLEQARRLGDRYFEAISISRLGLAALGCGESVEGIRLLNASLDLGRQMGSKWVTADALAHLGYASLLSGDLQAAEESLRSSLDLFYEQGERSALVLDLEWLALVYLRQADPDKAARLLGAAGAWRSSNREPLPPVYRPGLEQALAQLQSLPDDAAWRQGLALTLEQAVAYARKGRQ
jgi:tetratricopeptide (TPR) repeat protein